MKSFLSFKHKTKYNWRVGLIRKKYSQKTLSIAAASLLAVVLLIGINAQRLFDGSGSKIFNTTPTKTQGLHIPNLPFLSPVQKNKPISKNSPGTFMHQNITSTVFWTGEAADSSNGYIANSMSAWDEKWINHFGGVDDPAHRSGYLPAGFTPKENPFYVALPYNDITSESSRKSTAVNCLPYTPNRQDNYSWCKNIWIMVRSGQKIGYAQWEDVGPFEEDDFAYVFGVNSPKNRTDAKAGIDISPAVRDYLGLGDVGKVDWSFINAAQVPVGVWKQVVTTSLGSSLY